MARVCDDGIVCGCGTHHRADKFAQLCQAMEQEVAMGIFMPLLWTPSLPRLTAELVERYFVVIVAGLGGKLPTVLIVEVREYFMANLPRLL